MEKFKQMERDEELVASLSVPSGLRGDSHGSRVPRDSHGSRVPTGALGRPSYSPLRLPGEGAPAAVGGALPNIKIPGSATKLKLPGQNKPAASSKPPVAPAPPPEEKKKSWFSFGKKK